MEKLYGLLLLIVFVFFFFNLDKFIFNKGNEVCIEKPKRKQTKVELDVIEQLLLMGYSRKEAEKLVAQAAETSIFINANDLLDRIFNDA